MKIETEIGCMCIDFHQNYPYLIAAGFYDGSVDVYDLRYKPIKQSSFQFKNNFIKHHAPIWQVIISNMCINFYILNFKFQNKDKMAKR